MRKVKCEGVAYLVPPAKRWRDCDNSDSDGGLDPSGAHGGDGGDRYDVPAPCGLLETRASSKRAPPHSSLATGARIRAAT